MRAQIALAGRPRVLDGSRTPSSEIAVQLLTSPDDPFLQPEHPGPTSFGQIDVSNCTPALTPSTVSKIDVILSRSESVLRSAEASRERSGLTKEGLLKEVVAQSKEGASAQVRQRPCPSQNVPSQHSTLRVTSVPPPRCSEERKKAAFPLSRA